jgi:toxin ParE1/3/4
LKTIWSPEAAADIDDIWEFIAADNPDAADRMVTTIHTTLATLGDHPKLGSQGRRSRTREFVVAGSPYLLIYRISKDFLEVVHVVHGARNRKSRR